MAMQNPRRAHLGWCDPNRFESTGDFKDHLVAMAERAPTPEMRDQLTRLAEQAKGDAALPAPPVPITKETRPLAEGISQQGADFVCEPCGKRLKGYVQAHNHGSSESHRAKVDQFTNPTSVEAPPRGFVPPPDASGVIFDQE